MKPQRWWKSFVIAALMSTLASLLIVAVGPGFSAPPEQANNENASKVDKDNGKPDGGGGPNATDHDGDADMDPNTTVTEDNDTNDGNTPNNVVDDGDNAHPSGKDRSVEHGKSGDKNPNQGKSESNPDDSKGPQRCEGTCGQPDKPGGGGGSDKADQDGNNGCGNDDDFDDDNNGHCGKPNKNPPCQTNCNPPCTSNCDPVCPPGTDRAGQKAPGGDLTKCNNGHDPITLCHKTGNGYIILTTPDSSSLQGHLGHGDIYPVPANGCPTSPPPDCTGDNNPNNNQGCFPPVCPPGSNLAGQPIPGNNVNNCYTSTPPPVCPPGSNLAGQPIPGGNVNNCYTTPPPLCPADSDRPGQPMPGGNILNCYNGNPPPEVLCPAGTDLAGLPMPQGNPALCDDDVLGDLITDGDVDGDAQQRPAVQGGRILPFTGSSLLGFVLLGVQLLLAGGLFMRGRKRSAR
jgi:hypothetical protein